MGVKKVKVEVNNLTLDMYVSGLDRPWTQTPFPLQGFYIRNLDEIKLLRQYCQYVFIDIEKGAAPGRTKLNTLSIAPRDGERQQPTSQANVAPLKISRNQYSVKSDLKSELQQSKHLHKQVFSAVSEVMQQLDHGLSAPVQGTKRAASDMVDSILRNPDAFAWLARVREVDEYTYSHSVRSAVWAIIFGRHIGLSKKDLDVLALGVLLKDIGKARLKSSLITKMELTPAERQEYEKFIMIGVKILRSTPEVAPRVVAVVKTHCERVDGSGFPQQLKGDKIPLLGKIAGIVSFYDFTTNPRGQAYPLSPSKAVAKLYERRGTEFQEELVVEFIRAIGLYPTGTLVELNTGEVGVVIEQNFERRLKPKVMLVLNSMKQPLDKPVLFDLAEDDRFKQALVDAGKKRQDEVDKIDIATDMEPGSYDIDVAKIRDDYLFKKEKKGLFSRFLKD